MDPFYGPAFTSTARGISRTREVFLAFSLDGITPRVSVQWREDVRALSRLILLCSSRERRRGWCRLPLRVGKGLGLQVDAGRTEVLLVRQAVRVDTYAVSHRR